MSHNLAPLSTRRDITMLCSDVSVAFDRVDTPRMVAKLQSQGVHPKLVSVFSSWLQQRAAFLVVEGSHSEALQLADMVYQGTVFGPTSGTFSTKMPVVPSGRRGSQSWCMQMI